MIDSLICNLILICIIKHFYFIIYSNHSISSYSFDLLTFSSISDISYYVLQESSELDSEKS